MPSGHDRLILALDVADAEEALRWVERLRGKVGCFKVGLELFIAAGPGIVRRLSDEGVEIFLDLKLHDIPNTVAGAVRSASALGVKFLTVHAGGGPSMLAAASGAAREAGAGAPKLLGVTVLTSLDAAQLTALELPGTAESRVLAWAKLCRQQGLDGVVSSAHEAAALRRACGPDFLIVTPGIRPAGAAVGDQARVATAAEAVRAGADYLVVGRPITGAIDPVAAAAALTAEIGDMA